MIIFLKSDIDHVFDLREVAHDLLQISCSRLLFPILLFSLSLLHHLFVVKLLKSRPKWLLLGMHGWVLDRWQRKSLILLPVDYLNLTTLDLSILLVAQQLVFIEWNALLSTGFLEQLNHVLFCGVF